jgi:hypothetical protein
MSACTKRLISALLISTLVLVASILAVVLELVTPMDQSHYYAVPFRAKVAYTR